MAAEKAVTAMNVGRRPCVSATAPHTLEPNMLPTKTTPDSSDSRPGDRPQSHPTCHAVALPVWPWHIGT